jgi:hypothetical protein
MSMSLNPQGEKDASSIALDEVRKVKAKEIINESE